MKISKEEKALIKAYVNLQKSKMAIGVEDLSWLENDCTRMIENRNWEYRYLVEDFILDYILLM